MILRAIENTEKNIKQNDINKLAKKMGLSLGAGLITGLVLLF